MKVGVPSRVNCNGPGGRELLGVRGLKASLLVDLKNWLVIIVAPKYPMNPCEPVTSWKPPAAP